MIPGVKKGMKQVRSIRRNEYNCSGTIPVDDKKEIFSVELCAKGYFSPRRLPGVVRV
jgi:hypothetical protein